MTKALVIVDIHQGSDECWDCIDKEKIKLGFTDDTIVVAGNIAKALSIARASSLQMPIVFIVCPYGYPLDQYQKEIMFRAFDSCVFCDGEYSLAPFLEHNHAAEPVFCKKTTDAFTNKAFLHYLQERNVREICLAGFHTECCVYWTAVGGLRNGFAVTLLGQCCYTRLTERREEYWLENILKEVPSAAAPRRIRIAHDIEAALAIE